MQRVICLIRHGVEGTNKLNITKSKFLIFFFKLILI